MADEPRWQFEKVGLGYRCWAERIATEIRLTHIKRGREALTGELSVATRIEGVKTNRGILHVARFNVLSSTSRSSMAKMLEKRTPGHDLDWFEGLEILCQGVILSEQQGESFEEVGTDPKTPISKQFLVEPLLLKGRPGMIFGPGGVGKSLVALTCGISIAAGREVIPGIKPAAKGPVLYLDWETTSTVVNDRIQSIAAGHGFDAPKIIYRRCVKPLADDAEKLAEVVAQRGVVLVIVDSAAYAMGSSGEYGDANESVLRMHEALRIIGGTSLIIDHVNKTDAKLKPGSATPYGSAYKTWAARISWEVRKGPDIASGLRINLYHAKSNDTAQMDPIGLELDWDEDRIMFREASVDEPEDEDEDAGKASAAQQIVALITDVDHVHRDQIPELLPHLSRGAIRTALFNLRRNGKVEIDNHSMVRFPATPHIPSIRGGKIAR